MVVSQQKVISLEIENLKNLHDFEIDFENHPLTAILGVNGCGKSTILHALACCYKPINESESTNYKFSYFFTPTTHSIWEGSSFSLNHQYRIEHQEFPNSKTIYSKELRRWKPIYARRIERYVSFIGIKTCVPRIEEETKESLIRYTTASLSDEISLKVKEKAGYVMNRNYNSFNIHETPGRASYIGVECENREYSSLSMGAGEQRVFTVLKQVFGSPKYGLILIDEIDLLLHDDALNRLIEVLVERAAAKNFQIIFTTHAQAVTEFSDKINIRHILQTPDKTLCFKETKPDAIHRLTGRQERPLEVFVEDDLARATIKKVCGELGLSKYVSIKEYGAASNCFTTVSAALLKDDENIESMLFVLDGDEYSSESKKRNMLNKSLTGDTERLTNKRNRAINYIRQFSLPSGCKPEKYLHSLIIQLPEQNSEEDNEVIRVAREIVVVNDSHKYIDEIIRRMDFERPVGLKVVMDLLSKSAEWENYTSEVKTWLQLKGHQIIEGT